MPTGRIVDPELDRGAMDALYGYAFPGNVRELENILERACALCSGNQIGAEDLLLPSGATASPTPVGAGPGNWRPEDAFGDMEAYLEDMERQILTRALEESRWNKTSAAKLLGISFRSLRYRLKKLDLDQ